MPHYKKPDTDNLEKFLNDSANGVIWTDDSRIAFSYRSKTYTKFNTGETLLYVAQVPDALPDYCLLWQALLDHIEVDKWGNDYAKPEWAIKQLYDETSERVSDCCCHGIAHPNRDWLYSYRNRKDDGELIFDGVHACCGCCK